MTKDMAGCIAVPEFTPILPAIRNTSVPALLNCLRIAKMKRRSSMSKVWDEIKFIGSSIFNFMMPFIMEFMHDYGPILLQSALSAVLALKDNAGMSNTEKRNAALVTIKNDMLSKGYALGEGAIMDAIQVAYRNMVANNPPASS